MKRGRGPISLRMMLALGVALIAALAWWTWRSSGDERADGRIPIVFWGSNYMGNEVYTAIRLFEEQNPRYKVIMGSAVAHDMTGDAQRLLCAIAGDVPPNVVFFPRFAVGEWAAPGR